MNMINKYTLLFFVLFFSAGVSWNYVSATSEENHISGDEASAILQELKQIRSVLERIEKRAARGAQAAAPSKAKVTEISSIKRPSLGRKDAPVTIVEVSDYQCPYCKRFVDLTFKDLKKDYIDTGKVRLVFKDMPLAFHNKARKVAQSAHCAGDQGQYWQMHNKLFTDIRKFEDENIINHAKKLKLDMTEFKNCISSKRHFDAIDKDIADATKAGLTGTPSFVIGKTTDDIIKGDIVMGALPISNLKSYIEKYL